MPNLLSKKQRKHIHRERILRSTAIVLAFVLGTLLLAGAFLVPSYFLARSKESRTEEQIAFLQNLIERRRQTDATETAREIQSQLNSLSAIYGSVRPTEIVKQVIDIAPQGLSVTSFQYQEGADDAAQGQLTIEGVSPSREALLGFSKALEQDALFADVDLPVSSLAEKVNISFALTAHVVLEES